MYAQRINIAGVWHELQTTIVGIGAPGPETEGNVGQLYLDTDTDELYKCVGVTEITDPETGLVVSASYTWDTIDSVGLARLARAVGADIEYDPETETLILINSHGEQVGAGAQIQTSFKNLVIKSEDGTDDEGNPIQYIVLRDKEGNLISRDEISVNVSSITAGDSIKLVNRTMVNGAYTTSLNTVFGAEGGITLSYDFNIYDASGDIVSDTGTVRVTINNVVVGYSTIQQGRNSLTYFSGDGGQLRAGNNTITIMVTDSNGNKRSLTWNVTVINLTLSSDFNVTSPFEQANLASGAVVFSYTPFGGDIAKTVHFELDGAEIDTIVTRKYNTGMSYTLSNLSHGHHVIRCWMTAVVNEETITSNILRYDFLYVRRSGSGIIMAVDREENTSVTQGDILLFPYLVYSSSSPACNLYYRVQYERANAETGNLEWATYYTSPTYTADRTMRTITVKDYPSGNVRVQFFAYENDYDIIYQTIPRRSFYMTVAPSDLTLSISDVGLDLWMDVADRSNDETADTVGVWKDTKNAVSAVMTGFDFKTNGWMQDADGNNALKVSGGASVEIPYQPFRTSPIATGANGITIELDFMTDEVSDSDAVLLTCLGTNGGSKIGIEVKADEFRFYTSAQNMGTPFEAGRRMRMAVVVDAPSESGDRLIHLYVNGVDGSGDGVMRYVVGSDIIQHTSGFRISSTGAAIWIYGIRVYTQAKDRKDTATNYIASLPSIAEQAAEYNLNQIFDPNTGAVTSEALGQAVPDMTVVILEGPKMPDAKVTAEGEVQKEDSVVSGQIIDPDPALCVTFENTKIAVQGTSSAGYKRKNFKQTIKKCRMTSDPTVEYNGYMIRTDSMEAQKICFKKDVASSEQANNLLLARLYNDACPYKTEPQQLDSRVRQGIDGKPCVIFFVCTDPASPDYNDGQPVFFGKYNMNIDKGSENVFGFDMEDENGDPLFPRAQSWEFRNNTTDRVLFKVSDFVTMKDGKFEWLNDFEARYPEDSTDTADFAALCAWIASTNTANATSNRLSARYYVPANHLMKGAVEYETEADAEGNKINVTVVDGNGFERKVVASSRFVTETITVDGEEYVVMPVDQDGNELYYHDFDTANYREEVFYQEFSQHFDVSDAAFYYAFTEFFLMVDNRAKNMFLTSYDGVKWMFLPYDFDTANGTNNVGKLAFSYGLEDTDTVDGRLVYNDQRQSVLWNNFRNTFGAEIAATVNNMDGAGWITPAYLLNYFTGHQSEWPVSLWNEDENWTYAPSLVGEGDYLAMWQGKKEAQREWWFNRRYAYICSKYLTASALADVIEVRAYKPNISAENLSQEQRAQLAASLEAVPATQDFTITLYQDAYVNVKWGSYDDRKRGYADDPVLMEAPEQLATVNDTETYVYSAGTIKDLGDLSGLYVGRVNVANANHLESLVLGNADPDYLNLNCDSVTVGRNTALRKVDVRGLSKLSGTLALANCPNITEVYAERTKLAAVTTPNGGCLRVIHLPATITSLSLCNQTGIEDYSCAGYSNVQSLRVENCPVLMDDLKDILAACTSLTHVRLIDVDWQEDSADTLIALTQLGGLDENGATTERAVVTGRVNITNCSADDLTAIRTAFPHLTVTYTNATARLTFVNGVNSDGEGGEVLFTLDVPYGGTGYYPYDQSHSDIDMPTLDSTARYSYTFTGWAGVITNVTTSRTITATYSATVRSYGVTWKNGNTVVGYGTDGTAQSNAENIPFGTTAEYEGPIPVYSGSEQNMVYAGWTFKNIDDEGVETVIAREALTAVVGGTTVAEAFFFQLTVPDTPTAFESCTWPQILALISAAYDGTLQAKTGYATLEAYGWNVGAEKTMTLKSGETVVHKIWGFNCNEDDEGNTLPVTIGPKFSLLNTRAMNPVSRYLYGYTISDNAGDSPVTNERTAEDYEAYEMEGTALPGQNTLTYNVGGAGDVEITFTEKTWLSTIAVTVGGVTFTYNFAGGRSSENLAYRTDDNYFAQEDCSEFTARAGCVLHKGSVSFGYTNAGGTASPVLTVDGTDGDIKVFDRSLSQVDNNYRAIEFTAGSKITIPMTGAGKVVITARGIYNGGGYRSSVLRAWLRNTYIDQLPALIQQRISPVKRVTQIGGLDWDDYDTYYDKVIIPTYREFGWGSATTQPYCNESNVHFTTFSNNDMRMIACYRGGDQELASYVWASSPSAPYAYSFIVASRASGASGSYGADSSYAVLPGFCPR